MKDWSLRAVALLPLILLIGCSNSSNASPDKEKADLIASILEATAEVESYTSETVAEQVITRDEGNSPQRETTRTMINTDYTRDPATAYQVIAHEEVETATVTETQEYVTPDGYYSHSSRNWHRSTDDAWRDAKLGNIEHQIDPSRLLARYEEHTQDMALTEEAGHYVLTFALTGEQVWGARQQAAIESDIDLDALIETSESDRLELTYVVDKESYLPVRVEVDTSYALALLVEDDTGQFTVNSVTSYTNYNQIEPIVVPQEVQDNALELQTIP